MSFWKLGTVQYCLSAVKRVWSFVDCDLKTLNVKDDDDGEYIILMMLASLASYVSYPVRQYCWWEQLCNWCVM